MTKEDYDIKAEIFAGLSLWGAAALCKTVQRTLETRYMKMQAISMLKNIHIVQIIWIGMC